MGLKTKVAIVIASLLFIFTVTGFFILPPVMKSFLVKTLSKELHREVAIKEIKINPYALTVDVKGIIIKERDAKDVFVSFDEIFANIQFASLLKGAIIIKEIMIAKPYFNIIHSKEGAYNFSDLLEKKEPEKTPAKKAKPPLFSINNITISNGSIDFFDGPKNVRHSVREMKIAIPFISNMSHYTNSYILPKFSAIINDDFYSIQGQTKPFADSHETSFDVNIKDLDFPRYIPYSPVKMNFILKSGAMDLDAKISFIQSKDKAPSLTITGNMGIRNIVANDLNNNALIRVPSIEVGLKSIEPFHRLFAISQFSVKAPEITVRREKNGTLNLSSLMPEQKNQPDNAAQPTGQKKDEPAPVSGTENPTENPMIVSIDTLQLTDGKVSFHDLALPEPVSINIRKIQLDGENISTAKDSKSNASLTLSLERRGTISAKGSFGVNPLFADMGVNLKGLYLNLAQPYIADTVKAHIASGELTTTGKFILNSLADKGIDTQFSGNILISDFSAIDKINGDDFLRWKALSFNIQKAGHNPVHAHIDGISLSDFFARIIINPDAALNIQKIFGGDENVKEKDVATKKETEKVSLENQKEPQKDSANNITIGTITLQGGTIDFIDKSIKPSYSANLTEMGGRISGISLREIKNADVEMRGKLNQYIPLEIIGKVNPSRENLFVDLTAKFNDLDVSPMTPYSGKYIGYKIEKGKLSIDLKYVINKKKLDSQNVIFIDQLTLGDRVESPDATKLPVRLAIALLKDRKGQIKLDVPVSGSIDDPQFSVWRIVLKVIVNLLVKAATSPFALIGALFGGGEELSYLEFDYGSYKISDVNMKKIENLTKALSDRPSLKVDVEGYVDIDRDKEGLKQYLFNRKVKIQKLNELTKRRQQKIPIDDVSVEPQEYEKYLTMAYKEEKFAKPRNVIGLVKTLPVPEMEKLMLTHIIVADDDLRTLANQRANAAKDSIIKSGQVTPDRVFVIEPKTLSPERKEKLKDSRISFKLK